MDANLVKFLFRLGWLWLHGWIGLSLCCEFDRPVLAKVTAVRPSELTNNRFKAPAPLAPKPDSEPLMRSISPLTVPPKLQFIIPGASEPLAASPDSLNPDLESPPPIPEPYVPPDNSPPPIRPPSGIETLQLDFRNDRDNYGQLNRLLEATVRVRLEDGNVLRIRTGYDFFDQTTVEPLTNIPVQLGWEGVVDRTTIQAAAGLEFFSRLPTAWSASVAASSTVLPNVTLFGVAEYGPYKFNARTLENGIRAFRFGPNLYWQISPDTSLFSLFRVGVYNDNNREQQSFSRLEQRFGEFYVAANLFTWNYDTNAELSSGYFSPPDFLVYNAEFGWNGDLTDSLRCRLAFTTGWQRLQGSTSNASTYQILCAARFSPNASADFGYAYSNVRTATGSIGFGNHTLTGQVRFSF